MLGSRSVWASPWQGREDAVVHLWVTGSLWTQTWTEFSVKESGTCTETGYVPVGEHV